MAPRHSMRKAPPLSFPHPLPPSFPQFLAGIQRLSSSATREKPKSLPLRKSDGRITLFQKNHSPLEGESARQGRSPPTSRWGDMVPRPALPPSRRPQDQTQSLSSQFQCRYGAPPTAVAGAWRLGNTDSPSRGESYARRTTAHAANSHHAPSGEFSGHGKNPSRGSSPSLPLRKQ